MNQEHKERLQDISEIRAIMERRSKFLSLSGLSGVGAGLVALLGAWLSYRYLDAEGLYGQLRSREYMLVERGQLFNLIALAAGIMLVAGGVAWFFSRQLALRKQLPMWNPTARLMTINLALPLVAGAAFCVLLAHWGAGIFVAPASLIFYGLAIFSAGQHTHSEIRWLGASEVALGLIGCLFPGHGLIIWAVGFGALHILYGLLMYVKYDRA